MATEMWKALKISDLEKQLLHPSLQGKKEDKLDNNQKRRYKRSKLERYIDILKVVSRFEPIRRTHILYKANLAWTELQSLLDELHQAGAIRKNTTRSGVFCEITIVGRSALMNYANIQESLGQAKDGNDYL